MSKKITELPQSLGAIDADLIPIVEVRNGTFENKKITYGQFMQQSRYGVALDKIREPIMGSIVTFPNLTINTQGGTEKLLVGTCQINNTSQRNIIVEYKQRLLVNTFINDYAWIDGNNIHNHTMRATLILTTIADYGNGNTCLLKEIVKSFEFKNLNGLFGGQPDTHFYTEDINVDFRLQAGASVRIQNYITVLSLMNNTMSQPNLEPGQSILSYEVRNIDEFTLLDFASPPFQRKVNNLKFIYDEFN